MLAIAQVCRFLGGLVFGRVADKTGRFRGVLLWTNFISVVLALSTTSLVAPWRGLRGWLRVVVLALLVDGYAFFTSPSGTLIDAIAVVAQTSGGASYGSLRLWAAIGWGLAAVGMGAGVDKLGVLVGICRLRYRHGTVVGARRRVLRESEASAASTPPRRPRPSRASFWSPGTALLPQFLHSRLSGGLRGVLSAAVCGDGVAGHAELVSYPRHRADESGGDFQLVSGTAHSDRCRVRDPRVSVREPRHRENRRQTLSGWCAAALCVALHRLRDTRTLREIDSWLPVVCFTGAVSRFDVRDDVVGSVEVREAGRAAGTAQALVRAAYLC